MRGVRFVLDTLDGPRVLSWSDNTVRWWGAVTGRAPQLPLVFDQPVAIALAYRETMRHVLLVFTDRLHRFEWHDRP